MHKYFFAALMIFVWSGSAFTLSAQYTDTTHQNGVLKITPQAPDTNGNHSRKFLYKSFIVPTTLVVYGVLSLHTDAFQDVNETVKEKIYTERQPGKCNLDNYLQYAPAVAVYGLNAVGIHGKNNFRDRTIIYAMSSLFMGITVNSVKKIAGETRPDGSDNLSFPSGHTATAFAAAAFMWQEYKDVSPLYGIAGYAAAVATGYLRISNNKHWIGDVVAGAGMGIISTKLAYWIYPAIKRKFFRDKEAVTVIMPVYQNSSLGLGLVHHF